uniref:hypothetical protein n=1 Tax=Clostridium sp. NkU-1 TaxID=1095009 RepID=UPI003261B9B1
MKGQWERAVGSLLLIAAMVISSTNISFATNEAVAGTAAQASAQTEAERKILPASFGMPSTYPVKGEHPRVMFSKKGYSCYTGQHDWSRGCAGYEGIGEAAGN